jgi:hypothetical protein
MNDQPENCTRKRITINGENYYLVVGRNFVMATIPAENRPDRLNERQIVETLCSEITEIMGEI